MREPLRPVPPVTNTPNPCAGRTRGHVSRRGHRMSQSFIPQGEKVDMVLNALEAGLDAALVAFAVPEG